MLITGRSPENPCSARISNKFLATDGRYRQLKAKENRWFSAASAYHVHQTCTSRAPATSQYKIYFPALDTGFGGISPRLVTDFVSKKLQTGS